MKLKLNEPIFCEGKLHAISEIGLSGFLVRTRKGFPNDPSDKSPRYQHNVIVTIEDTANDFDYYTSIADYEAGKKKLDDDDLVNAFSCILGDAASGMMSYSDFLYEFGYGEADPKRTRRIHDACIKTYRAMITLGLIDGISIDNLYELISVIDEKKFQIVK